MRELIDLPPKMPLRDLTLLSINQTLARWLCNSVTTLAAVQSFAMPMVLVTAAGSRAFLATATLLLRGDRRARLAPPEAAEATTLKPTP